VVLVYGSMREIMMDGAREFGSRVTTELLALMQVKQATPVPYRPNLLGLVERFHRTWKDIVSLYVGEEQDDWDDFVPSALYAYNSARHATHGYQPNELMMGRKLRMPAELLRRSRLVYPHSTLSQYHEVLMRDLETARELAAVALQKEQARQAIYYNRRNVRHRGEFRPGQLVWIYRPARGPGIMKFGHRWRGPGQVVEPAGYDNFLVKMLESGHELVMHCSFLLPFYYPQNLLEQMAKDIALELHEEAIAAADIDEEEAPDADGDVDPSGAGDAEPDVGGAEEGDRDGDNTGETEHGEAAPPSAGESSGRAAEPDETIAVRRPSPPSDRPLQQQQQGAEDHNRVSGASAGKKRKATVPSSRAKEAGGSTAARGVEEEVPARSRP
jgi:hypothetical protein